MPERRTEIANCCEGRRCRGGRRGLGTAVVGLGLLALGVTLTLDNLGLADAEQVLRWWPVLLILLGVSRFLQQSWFAGSLWSLAGGLILAAKLDWVQFHVWDLWPLVLALFGANLLWAVLRGRRTVVTESADSFSATAVLGGVTRRITAAQFEGGTATALMGSCEIDLTGSETAGAPAEISAFAMWGGVEIKVPTDWEVRMDGSALLGGFVDSTQRSTESGKRKVLTVKGMALMGGVEAKN
jgi:predicted membrane protein